MHVTVARVHPDIRVSGLQGFPGRHNLGEGGNALNWAAIFRVTSRRILRSTWVITERIKPMNHQDSETIIITFLLLLPWLGRASVSAVAMWREHVETQAGKAKQNSRSLLSA